MTLLLLLINCLSETVAAAENHIDPSEEKNLN